MGTARISAGAATAVVAKPGTLEPGSMEVDHGSMMRKMELRCSVQFTSTAIIGGGIGMPALNSLLAQAKLTLSYGGKLDAARDFPLQEEPLLGVIEQAKHLLEVSPEGLTAAAAKAVVVGANVIDFRLYVATGEVHQLLPFELCGMGSFQVETLRMKLDFQKVDGLKASNAALALVGFDFEPWYEPVAVPPNKGDPWANLPFRRASSQTENMLQRVAVGPAGLPVRVEEINGAASTTAAREIEVTVGDFKPTKWPSSPADIEASLLRNSDFEPVQDAPAGKALYFAIADQPWRKALVGQVYVQQHFEDLARFDFVADVIPLPKEEAIRELVKYAATKMVAQGHFIKAVNAAVVEGVEMEGSGQQLPYVGMRLFRDDEPGFYRHPGLVAVNPVSGLQPEAAATLPKATLRKMASLWSQAGDDVAAQDAVLDAATAAIPGAVISTKGWEGGESQARGEVRRLLAGAVVQLLSEAHAAARPPQ